MKTCALTFDDGPNGDCTPALLDLLAKENVPATFFLVGKHIEAEPVVALAILQGGHQIGNHTYSHADLVQMDYNGVLRELRGCQRSIERLGETATLFRPPWGRYNLSVEKAAIACNLKPILWDAESQLAEGCILLHDGRSVHYDCHQQVQRTREIIHQGKGEGYRFVSVSV